MPNCEECRDNRALEAQVLPVIVHESNMERQQQDKKRLWLIIIILIAALILSNLGWAIYENSFETVESTTTESFEARARDDSVAIITRQGSVSIGGDGEVYEDDYDQNTETQDGK